MGSTHWIYLIIDEREKTLRVCTEGADTGTAHCWYNFRGDGNEQIHGVARCGVSDVLKAQVYDALKEILRERELDKVTVRELAERCSISRQGFYRSGSYGMLQTEVLS